MLVLTVFAGLYAAGGSADFWGGQLWIRRWLATFLLSMGMFWWTRDWKYAAAFPFIAGALTIPYGADVLWAKVGLRALYGWAAGMAFNLPNFANGRWMLAGFGGALAMATSVVLGVFNPTPNAIEEQFAIAFMFGFTYMLGVQPKKSEA